MRKVAMLGSALIAAVGLGLRSETPRVYGPRVYTAKDVGKSYGLHRRGRFYPAITADEAPTKRECTRRRRQMAAAA